MIDLGYLNYEVYLAAGLTGSFLTVTRTWSDSRWRHRPIWTWRHGPIKSLGHSPTRVTEFIDWGHGPTNVYSTNPRFPNKFINFLNPSEISQCHILSNLENGATDP